MNILGLYSSYYFLVIVLQAVCVIHCIRKGNGYNWIWLIVFLPLIGGLIYLFTEIITKREVNSVKTSLDTVIRPSGKIKDLEKRLEFSDTFENRVALADAYLNNNMTDEAILLYEKSRSGVFENDPFLIMQLIRAYFAKEQYDRVIDVTQFIRQSTDFGKSHARVLYALSLENTGCTKEAEAEFAAMKGRYSNYEARFRFAQFLQRQNREKEARSVLEEICNEANRMSSGESRNYREWLRKSREELAKYNKQTA